MTIWRRGAASVAALFLLTACTSSPTAGPDPTPDPTTAAPTTSEPTTPEPTPEPTIQPSVIKPIPDEQWAKMQAAGMIRPECPIQRPDQLRRVELNYVDFEGYDQRGYIVINADTAESLKRIFDKLYEAEFPIRRMQGVEEYGGDVGKSLADDNTSAFNCRRADQINAPFLQSPHANGRAVDINPYENPWTDLRCKCWTPSDVHKDRTPGAGKILEGELVHQTFLAEGWIWQNIDVPDYMHFDTGYPSAPLARS